MANKISKSMIKFYASIDQFTVRRSLFELMGKKYFIHPIMEQHLIYTKNLKIELSASTKNPTQINSTLQQSTEFMKSPMIPLQL